MESIVQQLQAAIQSIEETADLFYKQKEQEGYQELNRTIGCISYAMEQLLHNNGENNVHGNCLEIVEHLGKALEAMEVKDTILLADILQYEIKERFQLILDSMN